MKEKFSNAIDELKKQDKKNFSQSVDFIINLKDFDTKKNSVNLFIQLPFSTGEKKICAFLSKPNKIFAHTITRAEFDKWKDKKQLKRLARSYDFFVSLASLMPQVATSFGRVLGPAGKMPSPQLGILPSEDENAMKELSDKIKTILRIKSKEPSIKVMIGKEDMETEELAENANVIYNAVVNALPKKKENIKSVMLKLTMNKPVRIDLK